MRELKDHTSAEAVRLLGFIDVQVGLHRKPSLQKLNSITS